MFLWNLLLLTGCVLRRMTVESVGGSYSAQQCCVMCRRVVVDDIVLSSEVELCFGTFFFFFLHFLIASGMSVESVGWNVQSGGLLRFFSLTIILHF